MLDYWVHSPPVNISVAAFLGIRKNAKKIVPMEIEEFTLDNE